MVVAAITLGGRMLSMVFTSTLLLMMDDDVFGAVTVTVTGGLITGATGKITSAGAFVDAEA